MSNVVFEIFSEEIPATLQKNIAIEYQKFSAIELKKLNISAENISVGITLNRMVLQFSSQNCDKEKLTSFIQIVLENFSHSFPRTMLYPQASIRWIRPVRSLYAVIDNEVLSGEFFGIKLCNGTYVRKFDYIECKTYDEYFSVLKKENVEIDYNKRLNFIETEIHNINPEYKNYSLMNEIAGMSESNTKPILDILDNRFYILPFELIELVLRTNQRYVVFKPNKDGEIKFLIFCDKSTEEVKKGHQKVITARLDDALFYWKLDEKIKQDDNKQNLKNSLEEQIFIDDITWKDYLKKQNDIADNLLKDNNSILDKVKKSIVNTKLDLTTGVVREFPELQGIIGGYYFGYKFNPYIYDNKTNDIDILYYYFIDRIAYIQIMFQQGKQPTGSGDKYKVKNRMDDVVKAIVKLSDTVEISKLLDLIKANDDIHKLFQKRYQKYIESELNEQSKEVVKTITDGCIKALLENKICADVKTFAKNIQNTSFIKTYKRLNGYTGNKETNANAITNDVKEYLNDILGVDYKQNQNINILENEDIINNINNYLDKTKISENETLKKALFIIQKTFFEKHLPVEMI